MNPIKDVVIVGGGTAGLISALYLKTTYPDYNFTIIKSSNLGIIGVGEGSTEHFRNFINHCGFDWKEVINETNATLKLGIIFNDWNYLGSSYSHSVLKNSNHTPFGTSLEYDKFVTKGNGNISYLLSHPNFHESIVKNKLMIIEGDLDISNQYHFDTHKLNTYLINKCLFKGIKIKNCLVQDITQNLEGNITSLITSDNQSIKGDFFIDASGFKKVLSSKLGTKWKSYKDYLPTNQAITLSTNLDLEKGIEPYTKCTALSSGWTWKIPTQNRYGNGYVFDNRYIDADNALNEFNQHLGINAESVAKNIKFEAGKIDKFWIKNCVSIGLAGSFAEPLEAQSIGFSILQSQLLSELLSSWIIDKNISNKYNKILDDTWDNIISYVQLHYFTQRKDSQFWKDKPIKVTDFNKITKQHFSHGFFHSYYFPSKIYTMFQNDNFYQVYYGIGLLTKDKIQKRTQILPSYYKKHMDMVLSSQERKNMQISHIDYLKLIKENYSS